MEKTIDYRENQRVIGTFVLEDKGQDFTEIDLLENGVILGESIIFKDGRVSMLGVGTKDGKIYRPMKIVKNDMFRSEKDMKGQYIYIKKTEDIDPMPWDADTLNYKISKTKKALATNRFIKK